MRTRRKLRGSFKSKTMWFSFLLITFGVVNDNLSYLQHQIDPDYYGFITIGIGLIVGWLRWITDKPLEDKECWDS